LNYVCVLNYSYSAAFTRSAASFKVMAEKTFKPESSIIFAPSAALVP